MVLLVWKARTFVWQADKAAGGARAKGLDPWELRFGVERQAVRKSLWKELSAMEGFL